MRPLKGTPASGLFGATLGFFVGFAAVALFGPTAHRFKEVMDLSPMMVGFLVAVPSLTGSLLRIPFSAWVDATGGRKPFLVLLSLSIVGMAGLTTIVTTLYPDRLTPNLYPLLLLLGCLCGCGIATFSVGISQVAYWFPQKKQGMALGAYGGIGNLAPGIFSAILPVVMSGWGLGLGGAYIAWLAFLIVGTALYALLGRNSFFFQLRAAGLDPAAARERARELGQEVFPAGTPLQSLRISASTWKTWALLGIYFSTFGGFLALTAWMPTYWTQFHGLGLVAAGWLTALYSILTSLVRIGGGSIADRIGGENTARYGLIVMFAGALGMIFAGSVGVSVAGQILLALGMGVTNAAVFKLVPQEVPQAVGGAAGWVGGLGAFGGFAIPPLMGWFVGRFAAAGYGWGFVIFAVLAVGSIVLAMILKSARPVARTPVTSGVAAGARK